MKLIITSCFVQNPFCAPVVFVNDPADPAPQPGHDCPDMFSHRGPCEQVSVCEADAFCCRECLRQALSRLLSDQSERGKKDCESFSQPVASRKMKHARSVRKRARAQRLQLRSGAVPASLKRPRVFRLSKVTETDAPYPLDSDTFKASLAQALDALKVEPPENGAGHELSQEVNQDTGHDKVRGKERRKNEFLGK